MRKKRISLTQKNISIQEAFEQFQRHNQVKNLAPATIRFYASHFKPFAAYIEKFLENENSEYFSENSDVTSPPTSSINSDIFDTYILFLLTEKGLSATTVNIHIRAMRTFIYFCIERNYTQPFKIKSIKADQIIKEPYTNAELELLLVKPNMNKVSFSQYRNWVIVNFLLATGCRASTLVNIQISDLDLANGDVLFKHTKNRHQQVVPLSKSIVQVLEEYLSYREGKADDYLFVTVYDKKMTVACLSDAVYKYNLSRGVEKTSLHLFRHTYAKLYITAGGDPFRLQKLLGHSDLAMTKRYVSLYAEDLKDNYDRFNPLEQVSKKTSSNRIKL